MRTNLEFDGYFETSAKENRNIDLLSAAVHQAVNWEALPKVSSNELFRAVKDFLVEEKSAGRLLSTCGDLTTLFVDAVVDAKNRERSAQKYRFFQRFLSGATARRKSEPNAAWSLLENVPPEVVETCIDRVESQGLIRRLSFGNLVLLQPELVDTYASAMVISAKEEPDGLGIILEASAQNARFQIPDGVRIKNREQERLLIAATIEDMLRHEIALREYADDGSYLVFPSHLTRQQPDLPDLAGKTVVFIFEGALPNIYATLVVRASHSGFFEKKELWKNAATFQATVGGTCGLFLREIEEGKAELALFFGDTASEETRFQFEAYVAAHLDRHALPKTVHRSRMFVCSNPVCRTPLHDDAAAKLVQLGSTWATCVVCGKRISLLDGKERLTRTPSPTLLEMDSAADARCDLEASLASASGEMQTTNFVQFGVQSRRTTLAIVFTDIVGSTALGHQVGDEKMNEIRRAHFRQARIVISKLGGYEIKTIGDSFLVAFQTTVDALNFALQLFASSGHGMLKVRAGIHVGPVRFEERDVFGGVVNYAARVESCAKGAEIWLSDRAKEDIDQEKAKEHQQLRFIEHRNCVLKGFPDNQTLWSIGPS